MGGMGLRVATTEAAGVLQEGRAQGYLLWPEDCGQGGQCIHDMGATVHCQQVVLVVEELGPRGPTGSHFGRIGAYRPGARVRGAGARHQQP